jgi:CRP-like cAMP-binding protein
MISLSQGRCRNRLLQAMDSDIRTSIMEHAEYVTLKRGDILVSPNQLVSHVYFPVSGIASIVAIADPSNRIEAGVVGREGLVGLAAILDTGSSPHQGVVQMDSEGYRVDAGFLTSLARTNTKFLGLLLRYVQVILTQTEQTALANGRFSIEKRLARWILMCHDRIDGDELNFTHELLSVMLGVRRPGVTVATHVLEGSKMIKATRGRITVLSRGKLEEAAAGSYGVPEGEYERLIGPLRPPVSEGSSPAGWNPRSAQDGLSETHTVM